MYKRFFKRFFDFILSFLAMPFFIIMLIIISPIIYFSDKGTIFYNAPRLGKDGKIFIMYKFRSMKMNAPDIRNHDGSTFNSMEDSRLTKIGKFIRKTSIDELPQLVNVLKGDMSFIGPRPDLPEFYEKFSKDQLVKLSVKPGITGYNQAYFRNTNSLEKKFHNDIFYVRNISLVFDIKILLKTISTVIFKKGIYKN